MNITAIILTFNEELHIRRCIDSLKGVVTDIVLVDCGSTDRTREIAVSMGAAVLTNQWVNYATQFNWALGQLQPDVDWVLRIDADEYLSPEFAEEIRQSLPAVASGVVGVYCNRWIVFQGRCIRYGGVLPIRVLRLFRFGQGKCENRWMDEHIRVDAPTVDFTGDLIDYNLNSLAWWTEKHNSYSSREAVDLLNLRYGFMPLDSVASLRTRSQAGLKRWIKEKIYVRLPGGFRAFAYFFYRYVLRFGFLDGRAGTTFHFLQGFWYRYLVDAKVYEVEQHILKTECSVVDAIDQVLSIKVLPDT